MKWYDAESDAAARLRQRKYALLRRFPIPPDALPGSLALTHRRCGKPTCRCAQGEGHPLWLLTFMVDGKKHVEWIPPEWTEQIRPLVEQGREFKDPVAEVFAANAQLLALWRQQSIHKRPKNKVRALPPRPRPGPPYSQLTVGLTIPDHGWNGSYRADKLALPPALARNQACPCGSGSKYKRCCGERDEVLRRQLRSAALPAWMLSSRGKLHQFEKYACNVFALPQLLAGLSDTRRAPEIPTFDVVNNLLHTALLRVPSLNALEGDLKESDFQKLIPNSEVPLFVFS